VQEFLIVLTAVVLIYFLGIFYFGYLRRKAADAGKQNMQMGAAALRSAIKARQDTLERLGRLVAKAALSKECKWYDTYTS
jgi:hypothetical protein